MSEETNAEVVEASATPEPQVQVVEKIVEKVVEVPVEKIFEVEKVVERVVEKIVEVEKTGALTLTKDDVKALLSSLPPHSPRAQVNLVREKLESYLKSL